jgi:hypothetical protein
MRARDWVLHGSALAAILAFGAVAPAEAAARHKKPAHAHKEHMTTLASDVQALKDNLAAETAAREALQTQVQAASARADAAEAAASSARTELAAFQDAQIKTIPAQVAAEVKKDRPIDAFYVRGLKITPGGYLELAGIYRQHNLANDISTAFNTIPFPQIPQGHLQEYRFSARQSRIAALVEGKPTSDISLSAYGEIDFQAAAQTANSIESNSFNPRMRHLYGTIDWADSGWHFQAGHTWSLVNMDSKGITPRNEVIPIVIDGQYNVGFVWARQPGVRLTKDLLDKQLWISVSAENPQTTFFGTPPPGVIATINNGLGFYAGSTIALLPATQSVNHIPDFIVKVAGEHDIGGRHLHAELFGLARAFYERYTGVTNKDIWGGGVGAGLSFQVVPGLLDVQASGLWGNGIGRYGTGQLPDVTFADNGRIKPIHESIFLVGGILHATKALDVYTYFGQEEASRATYGTAFGYGNPNYLNTGCNIEGTAPTTCIGNTRILKEVSAGFWDTFYAGYWGQARFGLQYSYVERDAFSGVGGAPRTNENMIFTSFRFFPFQ